MQLSFDERATAVFARDAKTTIARTRTLYRSLADNFSKNVYFTQSIELLLDNFPYVIDGALAELVDRWQSREALGLPQMADRDGKKRPRVYLIAKELVDVTGAHINRETVITFLESYQRLAPLSIKELDVFPDMLRFVLIEEVLRIMQSTFGVYQEIADADRWFMRISGALQRGRSDDRLTELTGVLARQYTVIPLHFSFHLLQRISQSGKEKEMRIMSRWLRLTLARRGFGYARLSSLIVKTDREQAATFNAAIAALRWLAQMRWDRVSASLNMVDTVLRRDPAECYEQLSDETRGLYRNAVVRIAGKTGVHDVEVAREAVRLARIVADARTCEEDRCAHVGYFLIDGGLSALEQAFGYRPVMRERLRRFVRSHATRLYIGGIAVITAFSTVAVFALGGGSKTPWTIDLLLFVATVVLASEVGSVCMHYLAVRILDPRMLPYLDLESGIGDGRRTIVAMPSMFRNSESTRRLLRRMETNFIANNDPDIFFAALMDFRDATEESVATDAGLVAEFEQGIVALNEKYPSAAPRFSLFYRYRKWNPAEQVYMGWERKRGKLREFNEFLRGKDTTYVNGSATQALLFGHVRYLITLDEDTELVRNSAITLVGTIDHPLNRPVIDPIRRVVVQGYGIIEPRLALRFGEGTSTLFARLFGGFPGIETYSSFISDLHQDLFGEGIFHGKGIYDIDVVEETMRDRIPENTVLSHDLLEGLYARVGVAGAAHILEGFPQGYHEYMKRAHRWTRGDWQITQWAFTRRGAVFSAIGRWKIFDNLRRNMLPVALVAVVFITLFSSADVFVWSSVALSSLGFGQLFPALIQTIISAASLDRRIGLRYRLRTMIVAIAVALLKTVLLGVFALHVTIITIDAISRSMWRLFITKRKLLEWQIAYDTAARARKDILHFIGSMWRSTSISLILLLLVLFSPYPAFGPTALFWSIAWLSAPFVARLLSYRFVRSERLRTDDIRYLRMIAARTYWFFVDMATKESRWLMPDHFQEEPAAKRHSFGLGLSPTNLGMYLVSLSAARAMGLCDIRHYADRMHNVFLSLAKLERYKGHFFNWYELKGLSALAPKYVSSVDSANLALSLVSVRGAIRESLRASLLSNDMLEGIDDGLGISIDACQRAMRADDAHALKQECSHIHAAVMRARAWLGFARRTSLTARSVDEALAGVSHELSSIGPMIDTLHLSGAGGTIGDVVFAVRHITDTVASVYESTALLCGYMLVPPIIDVGASPTLHVYYTQLVEALTHIPSIQNLADGSVRAYLLRIGFADAVESIDQADQRIGHVHAWHKEVLSRLATAESAAQTVQRQLNDVERSASRYIADMDFTFLYNAERGLLHSGYNVMTGLLDEAFYDLLASEANSASIVGIAKRDLPARHWGYLGRKIIRGRNGKPLVASWAGSLFEYLGTSIYFSIPRTSFWGISARRAIDSHRVFARRFSIPWGMGESASADLDIEHNYHYQAFGDPSLGYKRGLSEFAVVAPYTTALALSFAPSVAIKNLRALTRAGAYGMYGFYDAIDYSGIDRNKKTVGTLARIYFAHHQGFIIASIANVILDGWVHRMVADDPSMVVATQLFEEKMPDVPVVGRVPVIAPPVDRIAPSTTLRNAPRKYVPVRAKEAQLRVLSNGTYHVSITSTGAGSSRYDNLRITEKCDDMLAESQGTFFYLFDKKRNALWSPTFMPTKSQGARSNVSVGEEIIVFEKVYEGIASKLSVSVDPQSPVEVRELVITNRRNEPITITVGVCADIALSRGSAEAAHPNYERLFISSDVAFDGSGILFSRPDPRDRSRMVGAGAMVISPDPIGDLAPVRTREAFFGSPLYRDQPAIMRDLSRATVDLPRYTLDSAAGFVWTMTIDPGKEQRASFILAAGSSSGAVEQTLEPYRSYGAVSRLLNAADRAGGRLLDELALSAPQAEVFSALASLLSVRSRYISMIDAPEHPAVGAVWKCGVSGTRPLLVLSVSAVTHLSIIRQIITCHSYFLRKGIKADIVIFNEHAGGYLKTFEDEIDFLLHTAVHSAVSDVSDIVHVRGDRFSSDERLLLRAVTAIWIDARKQTLADAVHALIRMPELQMAEPLAATKPIAKRIATPVNAPVDTHSLAFANGVGGFDVSSGEYAIAFTPDNRPPVPWTNVIANPHFGTLVTDRGMGFTWSLDSVENKLTVPYNDPLSSLTGEAIYVRDDQTGEFWSPLPVIGGINNSYEVRHGQGYSIYRAVRNGIITELRVTVDPVQPLKYFSVSLRNDTPVERALSVFGYFELLIGNTIKETGKHLSFALLSDHCIIARQVRSNTFPDRRTAVGIVGGADHFTVSKKEFIGRFNDLRTPDALLRAQLSSLLETDGEPCAALSRSVRLAAGEALTVDFFLGEAHKDSIDALYAYANTTAASDVIDASRSSWDQLPRLQFDLPDAALSLLCNRWLPYQTLSSRIYGRTGFSQIGGAFGFRDQLQDALALLWIDPQWVRGHILAAAAHQFIAGDVLSWWHPHNNFGARTRLSDPHLWLPYVVARYIRFTGDEAILKESIPYIAGDSPNDETRSVVSIFSPSEVKESLYEHCIRALDRALTVGAHGLPRMGDADWNDGMNNIGPDGRGESVWLAWFTIAVLRDMRALCESRGDHARVDRYTEYERSYHAAIMEHGWDGSWFLRAYTDAGLPVGGAHSNVFRIDSIVQSWAQFIDGNTDRVLRALRSTKEELHIWEGIVPLATPPATRNTLDLGTISDYAPGIRENGAQYNHAALWFARALFGSGDADNAMLVIDAVNPIKRSDTPERVAVYRGEPYAVAAEVYADPTYAGRAGWTWYTASAGLLYRTVIEQLLGLNRTKTTLTISPAFPCHWREASVTVPVGASSYIIRYSATEVSDQTEASEVVCDGVSMPTRTISLVDDGKEHHVLVSIKCK